MKSLVDEVGRIPRRETFYFIDQVFYGRYYDIRDKINCNRDWTITDAIREKLKEIYDE